MIKIQRKNQILGISDRLTPPLFPALQDMSCIDYHGIYNHPKRAFLKLSSLYARFPNGHNMLTNRQHINDMVTLVCSSYNIS